MSRTIHMAVQIVLTIAQFAPRIWPHFIPDPSSEAYHGMLSTIQLIVAAWSQGYNTNGTPQAMPFVPEKK